MRKKIITLLLSLFFLISLGYSKPGISYDRPGKLFAFFVNETGKELICKTTNGWIDHKFNINEKLLSSNLIISNNVHSLVVFPVSDILNHRLSNFSTGKDIVIYPNPATTVLYVNNLIGINTLEISNVTGKKLKRINVANVENVMIDTTEFDKGIYFITFYSQGKIHSCMKFVRI